MRQDLRRRPGWRFSVLSAGVVALASCGREPAAIGLEAPTAVSLDVVLGNGQTAVVGTDLGVPLVVRVLDSKGKGVSGLAIEFIVTSGGGKVYATTSQTNVAGEARNYWTLGTIAGAQSVEARTIDASNGAKVLHGAFQATAIPAAPVKAVPVAPNTFPNPWFEGTPLGVPVGVQILDQYGNAVPGIPVNVSATPGSVISPTSSVTDASGMSRVTQWLIGFDQQTLTFTVAAPVTPSVVTVSATGRGRWTFVGSGQASSCALSGVAYCWGRNNHGQLGNGLTTNSSIPVAVSGGRQLSKLSVGWEHVCGIELGSNLLYCWGRNDNGDLGDGTAVDRTTPVEVSWPSGVGEAVVEVAAGGGHTCAITASGATYCWGYGGYGVLGNGTTNGSAMPVRVLGDPGFVSLSAGISHTCGLTPTGEAYCWGFGFEGEIGTNGSLGNGVGYYVDHPLPVLTTERFTRLDLGGNYTCGVRAVGDVTCWGENRFGQVGAAATATCDGPVACNPVPVSAAPWYEFRSLSLGRAREWSVNGFGSSVHTCGVDDQARGFCWGSNDAGQLGTGSAGPPGSFSRTPGQVFLPTAVPRIQAFAVGYRHTCLLSETNQIWCVGANEFGQLGTGFAGPQNAAFGRVVRP